MRSEQTYRWAAALAAITTITLAGCSTSEDSKSTTTVVVVAAPQPVTVFAAASLTEAFNAEKATLAKASGPLDVTYSFAGSGALVTQIQQGAPADVIATADQDSMKKLTDAGLVEVPKTFARNSLEILVAPGNPKSIQGLKDLSRSDLTVVLGDTTVPAGKYAAQILSKAGVSVKPKSLEADVKGAVAKVTTGEADATIAYATDVKAAGAKAQGVSIPVDQNVIASYPIAITKTATHREAAQAFIDQIVSGSGQPALQASGFLPAG